MAKITPLMTSLRSNLSYLATLPVFWLCFVLLYQPQMWVTILNTPGSTINFNATIIFCILLGVVLISRGILLAVHRTFTMTWAKMIIWQLSELFVMSMFTALYITLMFHGEFAYFYIVGKSLYALLLTMVYPYLILNLAYAYAGKVVDDSVYDDSLMRFVDNTQKLKLMIASSAVLYVEADENYVHIRYLEGDRVRDYALRASMKSLEQLMQKHGLLRCQRSYYINPQHIKVLRRDKEGMISAELNQPNLKPIPVSPKYYDALAKWL